MDMSNEVQKLRAITSACSFLENVYTRDYRFVASILNMQADKNYDAIVEELEDVKEYIDRLIKYIKQ